MADALTGPIALRPARVLGRRALEPLLQLLGRHIDGVVEIPTAVS